MKSYREELWFETKTRRAYLNITRQVEAVVNKSGVQEGLVLVNAMHITASVYINDDEPGLLKATPGSVCELAPRMGQPVGSGVESFRLCDVGRNAPE